MESTPDTWDNVASRHDHPSFLMALGQLPGDGVDRAVMGRTLDAVLTDEETDNLIFLPGFSTADSISDISGRGVGMDVVRRSIQGLGGRITISSEPGKGSKFTMSLPLTLAVLDGMVVTAAEQTLVAPLSAIVESLTPRMEDVHYVGGKDAVIRIRDTFVPLIDVGVALGFRETPIPNGQGVAVLVESEGGGRGGVGLAVIGADSTAGEKEGARAGGQIRKGSDPHLKDDESDGQRRPAEGKVLPGAIRSIGTRRPHRPL